MSDSHHSQQPHGSDASNVSLKRPSRKSISRKYECRYAGCDKVYTRHEHLQRHQLNHNPKEIYACEVENCGQRFVRADLLVRHKNRHSRSYIPRNRIQSFVVPDSSSYAPASIGILSPPSGPSTNAVDGMIGAGATSNSSATGPAGFNARLPSFPHSSPSVPRNAAILLTPESDMPTSASIPPSVPAVSAAHGTHGRLSHLSPPTEAQLQVASAWMTAPPLTNMGAMGATSDMIRPSKAAAYYHTQPQHHHQQQQQPQYHHEARNEGHTHAIPEPAPTVMFTDPSFQGPYLTGRENFATWLFDDEAGIADFNVSQLPFLEGGLESPFNNNITYDYESLTSHSHIDTPPRQIETSDETISEYCRQEIVRLFKSYRKHLPQAEGRISNFGQEISGDVPALSVEMIHDSLFEFWDHVSPRVPIIHQPTFSCNRCPPLLLVVMVALGAASRYDRDQTGTLSEYGGFADIIITSARFQIMTSEEASPPVSLWVAQALLLVEFYEKMISTRRLHERSHIYHSVTLTLLRRGSPLIGRSGSESPPDEMQLPSLSTASPTPITPGAHPYSPSTPISNANHRHASQGYPQQKQPQHQQQQHRDTSSSTDLHCWWTRWAETEAMHRVVFAAFCLDITHAAMFGHSADMGPHEIRLPLPCDDSLWTAVKPEDVRHLDSNLRMYGVRPITFLDGLKRAVHGKEVHTHSFGRMIIMSGLLSVGWHLGHRETHLKWLDLTTPPTETQDTWRKTLLAAFDAWKESFDMVQRLSVGGGGGGGGIRSGSGRSGSAHASPAGATSSIESNSMIAQVAPDTGALPREHHGSGSGGGFNGPIQSAAVLYHLAHICLHVDIVDCQVYAGAKRLLGRKVSSRDYTNVVSRMRAWAKQASTQHAVLHAFRLLYKVLVDECMARGGTSGAGSSGSAGSSAGAGGGGANGDFDLPEMYSVKTEADPHRPWIIYYAALSIWSFVRAHSDDGRQPHQYQQQHEQQYPYQHAHQPSPSRYQRVVAYLGRVAELDDVAATAASATHLLADGLPDLLDYLQGVFADAHSELLQEAHVRLQMCREMLG